MNVRGDVVELWVNVIFSKIEKLYCEMENVDNF